MRAVVLPALLVLLAGCVSPVVRPDGPVQPWTEATSEPWFTLTSGCGFCDGSGTHPEAETTVVYADGTVLWYSFGVRPGETGFRVEPGLEAWQDEVEAVRAHQHDGYHDDMVRVFEVRTGDLGDDWGGVRAVLSEVLPHLRDPGPPRFDCEDCSAPWVEVLDPDGTHLHAALAGNYDSGESWDRVLDQLWAVRTWVRPADGQPS